MGAPAERGGPATAPRRISTAALCVAVCLLAASCRPGAALRGEVRDIGGEALPGVSVTAGAGDTGVITNVLGAYTLRGAAGRTTLRFEKTGYTAAEAVVDTPRGGAVEVPEVRLWPLPATEGVYFFAGMRYSELDHPRPMAYNTETRGLVHGTAVTPKARTEAPFGGPDRLPGAPQLIAHKLPPYDARLVRMLPAEATIPQPATPGAVQNTAKPVPEKVWIGDAVIPLVMRPVDDPNRQLMELIPGEALTPGVYAVHWGALDGFGGVEPRVFLFRVPEPQADEETADEETLTPEERQLMEEREKQRLERLKEMNQETGEGMG